MDVVPPKTGPPAMPAGSPDGGADVWVVGNAVRSRVFSDAEDDEAVADVAARAAVVAGVGIATAGAWMTGAAPLEGVVAGSGVFICGLDAVAARTWDGATGVVGTTMVCCAAAIRAAKAKAIMTDLANFPSPESYAPPAVAFQCESFRMASWVIRTSLGGS